MAKIIEQFTDERGAIKVIRLSEDDYLDKIIRVLTDIPEGSKVLEILAYDGAVEIVFAARSVTS